MRQYLDLLEKVKKDGTKKSDRTGTGTLSIFGYQLRCDLAAGFPLLTTKKIHFHSFNSFVFVLLYYFFYFVEI